MDPPPHPAEARPPGPTLENRLPAEGINSSTEHPLREFAWVIGVTLGVLLLAVAVLGAAARWLAPLVPFSAEVAVASRLLDDNTRAKPASGPAQPPRPAPELERAARSAALQALANRLARQMNLPPDMPIVVRSEPGEVVNAYATIGGRIRIHDGLLRRLRSEDELAALLAHEIAHVQRRHVAGNLGHGLALALLVGTLSPELGTQAAQALVGQTASLVVMGYSREQEADADSDALKAVAGLYGHAGGVLALFSRLAEAEAEKRGAGALAWLRSHPLTSARQQAMAAQAAAAGWAAGGAMTPLPAVLMLPARAPAGPPAGPSSSRPPTPPVQG